MSSLSKKIRAPADTLPAPNESNSPAALDVDGAGNYGTECLRHPEPCVAEAQAVENHIGSSVAPDSAQGFRLQNDRAKDYKSWSDWYPVKKFGPAEFLKDL